MKAALLYSGANKLSVEDVPVPVLTAGAARIHVKACGICGSDVHAVFDRQLKPSSYPRILGHEASGVVMETGDGVSSLKKGDHVVIAAGTSCGSCPQCDRGRWNACEKVGVLGFDSDGAFAEEIVVAEKFLVKLPDSVPFDQGAILADAVSTPYHAIKYAGRFEAGESAAVFGCGGLGIHGVLILKALGASRVFALDLDDGALENASKAGADVCLNIRGVKSPGKLLKEKSGGIDLAVDFSGFYGNVEQSMRCLNTLGRIVLVGLGRSSLEITIPSIITFRQLSICGSYGSDARALPELLDLFTSGKLNLSRSITSRHPLSEVNDCLTNLHERKGNPIRFIMEP